MWETHDAGELNEVATITRFADLGKPADAADLAEPGFSSVPGCAGSGWIMPISRSPERSASSIMAR